MSSAVLFTQRMMCVYPLIESCVFQSTWMLTTCWRRNGRQPEVNCKVSFTSTDILKVPARSTGRMVPGHQSSPQKPVWTQHIIFRATEQNRHFLTTPPSDIDGAYFDKKYRSEWLKRLAKPLYWHSLNATGPEIHNNHHTLTYNIYDYVVKWEANAVPGEV